MGMHRTLAEAIDAEFQEARHIMTSGNSGGTNSGAFKQLPLPEELKRLIDPTDRK